MRYTASVVRLILTRPSIAARTADAAEYRERADDVLGAVARGILKPSIWKTYPLSEASKAHADLESGKSHGAVVLAT